MKELSVFKRGQVWYINDNRKNIGSIQGKSRPYLVVSNDKCNANSPVIHMAPLTTQDKTSMPTHVQIYDPYRRINQVILCEQVMPKSVPDITPIAEYRYALTEEKMKEVDRALAAQFGIPYGGVTMDDFEELLDMLKDEKIAQIKAEADKLTTPRAEAYVDKLLEEVDKITTPSVPVTAPVVEPPKAQPTQQVTPATPKKPTSAPVASKNNGKPMSQIDKFNMRLQRAQELQGKAPAQATAPVVTTTPTTKDDASPKRNRWTEERKREFVADAENPNMSKSEVLAKYNMTNSTYATTLCKFRKELASSAPKEEPTNNSKSNAEKFLDDYDSKPVSEMMELYGLPDKKAVVNQAAIYRAQLGR